MDTRTLPRGPGKTAPRLIFDLLEHDPRFSGRNGRNLLADPAPMFKDKPLPPRRHPHECKHSLMKKPAQTNAPISEDERPDPGTIYVVASYCTRCKHHFTIGVDFTQASRGHLPCHLSNKDNPLHHLRLVESWNIKEQKRENVPFDKYDPVIELYRFVCSGAYCPVTVEIKISSPRLPLSILPTLVDAAELEARGNRVIAGEPERYVGLDPLTPTQVFSNLRQYLQDAKAARVQGDLRRIARRNKKYFLAFADECDDLFNYLDFKALTEEGESQNDPSYFWQLPAITDINSDFVDDVLVELELLITERPPAEARANPKIRVTNVPVLASKDISRSLGYHGYPTTRRTEDVVDLTIEPHPHYASLGALDSFTDDLLIWAYDRQCECDSRNKPYYLDCLLSLANGRQSSDLHTRVVMATSAGEYGLKEIEDAYRFFTLDPNDNLTDDHIIGNYKSRIESAPRQKDEARQCLRRIARARNSDKIEAVANDKTMSHNEALEYLGISADIDSDTIIAAAEAMVNDIGTDAARIAAALRVIASHRGGDIQLNQKAKAIGGDVDVAAAYQDLDIRNRTVPDETVFYYYKSRIDADASNPKALRDHADALRIIADDRDSLFLWAKLADPDAVVLTPNEPVGLDNIGNTCYLNSLLQFYYTIKSVREVVVNIDKYRMDLNNPNIDDDIKKKQVGGRKIKRFEISKAQKFVDELHNLFELLRTAPTKSVRPTNQLAELTLFSDALEADYRKKSISSPNGPPSLATILHGSEPVFGPEGPPPSAPSQLSTTPIDEDIEMIDRPGDKSTGNGSDTSEATLVDMDTLPPYSKENQVDYPLEKGTVITTEAVDVNQEDDAVMVNGESPARTTEDVLAPPEKPPPVPPRNKAGLSIQTDGNRSDNDKLSFGAQQDVTEVIGNVVWRLSCAIKPTSIDDISGEQIDIIRDTFFGANAVYTQKARNLERKVESWAQLIVFPHSSKPRDIYEALDVVFDEQTVDVENALTPQYASITKLPPILQIHIQRTDYDPVRKIGFKNRNPVALPETIYMDRYMDSNDPGLLRRRREAWKWKSQLRNLEARQTALQNTEAKVTVPDALIDTRRFISNLQEAEIEGLEVDDALPEAIEERIAEVATELDNISTRIAMLKRKLTEQFTDLTKFEYKLQTVFIHRGESGGGHYWIYLYDFENDIWREYNDDHVSIIKDRKKIFHPDPAQSGTPYYLAYVRSADKKDLVDAVVREAKEVEMAETDLTNTTSAPDKWDDEAIAMMDDEPMDTRHVEHVKPRPILPRPTPQAWDNQWEQNGLSELDANGKNW